MEFDFDPRKSAANKAKHGIHFTEAQALWADPDLLEIPVRTSDEQRFLVIGKISERHWSGVITYRSDAIRIISIRRSLPEELTFMKTKATDFDKKFAAGEDITEHLDLNKAQRPEREQKRVNVDFPVWMIQALDREARRLGVPRQSIIKLWIADRLDKAS